MSKTYKESGISQDHKHERKIYNPDYTLEGIASEPIFLKEGKQVKPPKAYKKRCKTWKS
jgi:hypothetical protein